jgi:carbonic anhydrase/acetyltransferase-like protein (isoleucine patch superfamily)
MAFYQFNGIKPVVHPSSFIHPQATVTGQVVIERMCTLAPGVHCVATGQDRY